MNGDDVLQALAGHSREDLARALRSLRRRHARQRADTELTYRELSGKTGYAHGVIGDYFSGKVLPPTDRLDVLAGVLGATGQELRALATLRDMIEERRRRGRTSEWSAGACRSLPRDVGLFTGRGRELRQIGEETVAQGALTVCAIGGMAGIGKTALAVHAAHMLADCFPDGQVFLSLHGHTPGRRPADPADVLADLLLMCGVPAQRVPKGLEGRASLWRTHVAGKRMLVVLDDAAGHEQVRPLLPGTAGSLVLITCRRHLTALEGVRAISLDALSPGEAAELLAWHADREDLRPGDDALAEICRLCGFLPLALGMLGRQLHHHPTWTAGGLAVDLTAARGRRLELMRAEDLSVAASFDLSYQHLGEAEQRLFRHLGLHPGNDFDAYAAAALDSTSLNHAAHGLAVLYDRYLVEETTPGRYRFHDLIREHSQTLATADLAAEQAEGITRILDYYASAACAASQHLARRAPVATTRPPKEMPCLSHRDEASTWMNAEFANLSQVTTHAMAVGQPGHVVMLTWALNGYMLTEGHWHEALALHRLAIEAARKLNDPVAEAGALTRLAVVQRLTGQLTAAVSSLEVALAQFRELCDQTGQAYALNELGVTQYILGEYPAAAGSITSALELCRSSGDAMAESGALNDLGLVQQAVGQYATAADTFTRALQMHRQLGDQLWEANALNNLGIVQRHTGDLGTALASDQHALELYRALGNPFGEARALTEIGAVELLTGDCTAAASSHRAALQLYQKIGNQAGAADALNKLGEVALAEGRPEQAAPYHQQALAIAESIASPAEQARAIEGIGHCELRCQHHRAGRARLDQALAIYQQIGAPDADRVADELKRLHSEQQQSASPRATSPVKP